MRREHNFHWVGLDCIINSCFVVPPSVNVVQIYNEPAPTCMFITCRVFATLVTAKAQHPEAILLECLHL